MYCSLVSPGTAVWSGREHERWRTCGITFTPTLNRLHARARRLGSVPWRAEAGCQDGEGSGSASYVAFVGSDCYNKIPQIGWIKKKEIYLFSHSCEGWRSKIKVPECSGSDRLPLSHLQMAACCLCALTAFPQFWHMERRRDLCLLIRPPILPD